MKSLKNLGRFCGAFMIADMALQGMSDNELTLTINSEHFEVFNSGSGKDSSHKLIVARAIKGLQSKQVPEQHFFTLRR